jgi:hypothetical protein
LCPFPWGWWGARGSRGKARAKIARPAEALEGAEFFPREHGTLLKAMLARIDRIDAPGRI